MRSGVEEKRGLSSTPWGEGDPVDVREVGRERKLQPGGAGRQGPGEVRDGLALAIMEPALDLERKDVPALAVLDGLPDLVFTQRRLNDFVQRDAGVYRCTLFLWYCPIRWYPASCKTCFDKLRG